MKRFRKILLGLAVLGAAEPVAAMSLGLRLTLWNRSAHAVQLYSVEEVLGGMWSVGTNGVAAAKGCDDVTAAGGKSVTLTAEDDSSAWVETVATNGCRVSFDWKCSCEPLAKGHPYDYMSFAVDGERQGLICGETDWTNVTFYVTGEGEHRLRWMFQRDEDGAYGEDCAWMANVSVVSSVTVTFAEGGATAGSVPEPIAVYSGESVVLPGQGALAWPMHSFLGWSDGTALYAAGEGYLAASNVSMTAQWAANTLSAPVISALATYEADSCTVTITADAGATIYYTLDGSVPGADGSGSCPYQGVFTVTGSATIKAIAVRDGYFDSEVAQFEVMRLPWTFGEYLNWPEQAFSTGGDAAWTRAKGVSEDGYALRSGAITHSQTSRLETVVSGAGSVSFACRVEGEIVKRIVYDGLAFCIDGIQQGDLMGNSAWETNTFEVTGGGSHTLSWLYIKDEEGAGGGEDCAWLDAVTWTPTGGNTDAIVDAGGGKSVTVPGTWLAERTQRAATDTAANGRKVWECYVLGLNPEDNSATNDFRITSLPMKADGTPDLDNLVFDPPQERWNVSGARPVLKGAANLGGPWEVVDDKDGHAVGASLPVRFFRVEVELP